MHKRNRSQIEQSKEIIIGMLKTVEKSWLTGYN